ncbi:MAG: KH domain-containing protein [Candidatus Heimdallarchaeota archaeon]|nr:KH domain-containing protein [Candidatus Heimdallarchaeota archaeon]
MSKVIAKNHAIVIPGDLLAEGPINYGEGIVKRNGEYYSSVVGLFQDKGDFIQVKALKGKYIPRPGDLVIGKVTEVGLTSWIVDIGSPYIAILSANNATEKRFDPIKDDARKIFGLGDIILTKIASFDRTRDPLLITNERGLGKLRGGRLIEIEASHIPRVIGKKGTMINMIKRLTRTQIITGQNGLIWVNGKKIEDELKAIQAITKIELEAHTQGLTDRIRDMISEDQQ